MNKFIKYVLFYVLILLPLMLFIECASNHGHLTWPQVGKVAILNAVNCFAVWGVIGWINKQQQAKAAAKK